MKLNLLKTMSAYKSFCLIVFALLFILNTKTQAQELKYQCTPDDIISACRESNIYAFESVVNNCKTNYSQLGAGLLNLFKNPQSNFSQSAAAYFLGEIHYRNGVDDLASEIVFRFHGVAMKHLIKINIPEYPAMEALVEIGNPSIPAVIRNLAESDDAKVRELSLQVLYRIDGDKDIVQLRLQKALKAETDSQKQTRLQSALKALGKSSFGN